MNFCSISPFGRQAGVVGDFNEVLAWRPPSEAVHGCGYDVITSLKYTYKRRRWEGWRGWE